MASNGSAKKGFSDHEKAAMKARAKELAAEERMNKKRSAGEEAVKEAISVMTGSDKEMAQRFHELVTQTAPDLWPKTWYGMPAYAKGKNVVCFFQSAEKFEARYATVGFNDHAMLDNGNMWPVAFAIVKMTEAEEKLIVDLVRRAVQ